MPKVMKREIKQYKSDISGKEADQHFASPSLG
jgi:hypothetical protein